MTLLLAPAGTREMAFMVIDEGADALYMGPMGWSLRTQYRGIARYR